MSASDKNVKDIILSTSVMYYIRSETKIISSLYYLLAEALWKIPGSERIFFNMFGIL